MPRRDTRRYVHTTRSWYYQQNFRTFGKPRWVDEVFFYNNQPYGEMAMRWYDHDNQDGEWSARLEVFIQSAEALVDLQDLLQDLATLSRTKEYISLSPQKFCRLLERHGFVDGTAYRYEMSYPNE